MNPQNHLILENTIKIASNVAKFILFLKLKNCCNSCGTINQFKNDNLS